MFVGQFSFAQDYDSFVNELTRYKTQFFDLTQNETDVEEFESSIDDIHRDAASLKGDIEDYMKENSLYANKQYKELLSEVNDYSTFTATNSMSICLYHMDKFFNEMGASFVIVKESNEVRVIEAVVGNFKFYYAYGLKFQNYSASIECNVYKDASKRTPLASTRLKYKLLGYVRKVTVVNASNTLVVKKLVVTKEATPSGFDFLKCNKDYPRL